MKIFDIISRMLFVVVLVLSGMSAVAIEIMIVDQNDQPVRDAYVAIPDGEINAPSKESAIMDQVNVRFVPQVLAIDVGQSVLFPNSDNIRHHVYSFSKPKQFEIKLYDGVPKTPISFDKPGLVALGCNIHDAMLGYIFVSPWPDYTVTSDTGKVTFTRKTGQVAVWHPWMKGQKNAVMFELSATDEELHTIRLALTKPEKTKTFKGLRKRYDD